MEQDDVDFEVLNNTPRRLYDVMREVFDAEDALQAIPLVSSEEDRKVAALRVINAKSIARRAVNTYATVVQREDQEY